MDREQIKVGAVSGGLVAWLLVTAAGQLPDQRFDALVRKTRIPVPNWRFFGPRPGSYDTHLLYRDLHDGEPGPWDEIPVTGDRPWYALVWNARNRSPKALFDACQNVTMVARAFANNLPIINRTPGYRFLAEYVCGRVPHQERATGTQFLLMESHLQGLDDREMKAVFASSPLSLESGHERGTVPA